MIDHRDRKRYEAEVDGARAGFLTYQVAENVPVSLIHTEVHPAYEGMGVGGQPG